MTMTMTWLSWFCHLDVQVHIIPFMSPYSHSLLSSPLLLSILQILYCLFISKVCQAETFSGFWVFVWIEFKPQRQSSSQQIQLHMVKVTELLEIKTISTVHLHYFYITFKSRFVPVELITDLTVDKPVKVFLNATHNARWVWWLKVM